MQVENSKLLTIAIPTYSRSANLSLILDELIKQNSDEIEILIGDDMSPDDTPDVVATYLNKLPNLRYVRNPINLGFSRNVYALYNAAKTRYVWFLCDDEEIVEGNTISRILSSLKQKSPVVAVYNTIHEDPYGVVREIGSKIDTEFTSLDQLDDYQPLMRTTFLSTLILEKRNIDLDLESYPIENNVYVQVLLSLLLLSDKLRFMEFSFPIVRRNVGFKYGDFFKFYMVDHLKAIHMIPHIFNNKMFIKWSIRDFPTALKLYYSQKLGLFRYSKQPTFDTVLKIVLYYKLYSILILFFYLIYKVTPGFLVKYIYLIQLKKIHGPNKAIDIYHKKINRAFTDKRATGFTSYR